MYIYEQPDWPKFQWDEEQLKDQLILLRHKQGRLMGGMEAVGFQLYEKNLLETFTQDVVKTSQIEGEILDQSQVRSSVARHLGMDMAALDDIDKNIEGVVTMMLNATQKFYDPVTKSRLFAWHSALFPGREKKMTVGDWRKGPVQVISGQIGKEVIHFEAPLANQVEAEMARFLNWINEEKNMDPLLMAGVSHLWFVTIHPFDDGNGRIGRAIADLFLARSENSPNRFYSLSAQIQAERKKYYSILEKTQKGSLEITAWLKWFLACLDRALDQALSTFNTIVHKTHFWESISQLPLNERQRKVINRLLDGFDGKLTTSKWAKLTKTSQDTAYRDILDLIEKGVLVKNPEGGRSTSYSLGKFNHF